MVGEREGGRREGEGREGMGRREGGRKGERNSLLTQVVKQCALSPRALPWKPPMKDRMLSLGQPGGWLMSADSYCSDVGAREDPRCLFCIGTQVNRVE